MDHMAHLCDLQIIKEDKSGIKEVCKECKRVVLTPKGYKGAIDNKKYLEEHARDFIQPGSRYFDRFYGKGASKNFGL